MTAYFLGAGFICALASSLTNTEYLSGMRWGVFWAWMTAACWLAFELGGWKTPAGDFLGWGLTTVATLRAIACSAIASKASKTPYEGP